MRNYILAAVVVILVLTASFDLLQTRLVRGGRAFVWNAYIKAEKPPGDPWIGFAHEIIVRAGAVTRRTIVIATHASALASVTCPSGVGQGASPYPAFWSVTNVLYLDPSVDIVRLVVFTGGWVLNTNANVVAHLGFWSAPTGGYMQYTCYYIVYQPAIVYQAGIPYRWTIRFTYFNSSELKVMPLSLLHPTNIVHTVPMSVECQRSDGTWSSSGLTLSTTSTLVNATHVLGQYVITFGTAWNATYVHGCRIFTTDTGVINDVNAATVDRDIAADRLYFVYHTLSTPIQVLVNDRFVYRVWVVLTSETVQV